MPYTHKHCTVQVAATTVDCIQCQRWPACDLDAVLACLCTLQTAYAHPWVPAGWVPSLPLPPVARSSEAGTAAIVNSAQSHPSGASSIGVSDRSDGTEAAASSSGAAGAGQVAAGQGSEVLLGVVAGDIRLGVRAFRDWCWALGLPYVKPESRVDGVPQIKDIRGGVYIKYSSKTLVRAVMTYAHSS